jgi:hypothetical protein
MKIKNNMWLLTKCVDIVYFKNSVDKITVSIADKSEAFLPLFHDWPFLTMLYHALHKNFALSLSAAAR